MNKRINRLSLQQRNQSVNPFRLRFSTLLLQQTHQLLLQFVYEDCLNINNYAMKCLRTSIWKFICVTTISAYETLLEA